jgi:heme/copper-type cytochrome/quinol oxidase subunit 2
MDSSKAKVVFSLFVVLTVVLIVTNIFFYRKLQTAREGTPQAVNQEETRALIDEVSQLIVLPEEAPTIATVTDLEKLKSQPFFAKAKIGDKVLIYAVARKAILYSPAEHKIVEVAPLLIGETAPATPTTSTSPESTQ